MLILPENDLRQLLAMGDVMKAVEEAFLELAELGTKSPKRTVLEIPEYKSCMLFMPAYLQRSKSVSLKVVGLYPDNAKRGLETLSSILCLMNPETGMPLAVMDGKHITAMRTAAMTAIATEHLARRSIESVGVIGAGVQAEYQLRGILEVRSAKRVYVYDVLVEKSQRFAEKIREELGLMVQVEESANDVASKSDILIVATTSKQPVFDGGVLAEGVHVASIGWVGPEGRELDTTTVKRAKVVVDTKEGVLSESGDILIPIREGAITVDHIWCELKDLVSNRKKGRESEEEITLWKSVGVGVADAAAAKLAYQKALEKRVGLWVEI
jgi:ornithine cyclodeaminase/alanine dehydrogenase-like protein (mu-crystallin family)